MNLKDIFVKHNCDKGIKHDYWKLYQEDFEPVRNNSINILEIGTFKGESTNAWLEYFPQANIYTIDTFERVDAVDLPMLQDSRVTYAKLDSTALECNKHFQELGQKFDFIIDDGLHTPEAQRLTFENLIQFTNTYYIEDVWNLDKVKMNDPWIQSHANDFTQDKWQKLLESTGKYSVTHHDWRSKKKQDSYILKVINPLDTQWKHT